jgi:hypothetical protein
MKRLLFMMVIVNTLIISTLSSCNKSDSLPPPPPPPPPPFVLNLTADHWEAEGGGVFVSTFNNVIPAENSNSSVKVYLVTNGEDKQIDHPISFSSGALWATKTQTDVKIYYRGNAQNVLYLNIKLVID